MTSNYAGTRVHFLRAATVNLGTSMASGSDVLARGAELVLTDDIIEASRDRFGNSWIERELSKGDESMTLRAGPWPEGAKKWVHGSAEWAMQREQARLDAWAQPTEEEQQAALRAMRREFGPSVPTSTTLRTEK